MFEFVALRSDKAKCKNQPTEWWFPEFPPSREKIRQAKQAKQICSTCVLKVQCLAYGKATGSYGIWGGETLQQGRQDTRPRKQQTQGEKK